MLPFSDSHDPYQPDVGAIKQIIALEQIFEKPIEFNFPVFIVFIDFTKEFESIKTPSLSELFEEARINKKST